jgi:hypothetical protein
MRSSTVSIPGMAIATLLCLVATGMAMADAAHYGSLALALFSLSWLVFYVSIAMPIRLKRRDTEGE